EQTRDQERDRDVGGDAERLHRQTERLSIEERTQEPQDVKEAGRVVAEVPGLVEATGSDRREPLRPGLIGAAGGWKALRAHEREEEGLRIDAEAVAELLEADRSMEEVGEEREQTRGRGRGDGGIPPHQANAGEDPEERRRREEEAHADEPWTQEERRSPDEVG